MIKDKIKRLLQSRFYRIYFGVVILVIALMCVGRVWLGRVLADYESSQPVYVAEDVVGLFEAGDYEKIYTLDASADAICDGDESFYLQSMQKLTDGKTIAWDEAFSPNEDERSYEVTLDGDRFASFSLVHSGETTKYGNPLWELGEVSTLVQLEATPTPTPVPTPTPTPTPSPTPVPVHKVQVIVPSDLTVTVDGVKLTNKNAILTTTRLYENILLPKGHKSPAYRKYVYETTNADPVVKATDAKGKKQKLSKTGKYVYGRSIAFNSKLQKKYEEDVVKIAKRVALVTSSDYSVRRILTQCRKNSPAYKMFSEYSNTWGVQHTSTDFKHIKADQFYVVSGKYFTCRVRFDFVLRTVNGRRSYPTTYNLCFVRSGNGIKLYNLLMS